MPPRQKTSRSAPNANDDFAQAFRDSNARKLQDLKEVHPEAELTSSEPQFRKGLENLLHHDENHAAILKASDDAKASLYTAVEGLRKMQDEVVQLADRTVVPQVGEKWQDDFDQLASVLEAGQDFVAQQVQQMLGKEDATVTTLSLKEGERQVQALELLGVDRHGFELGGGSGRDILADAVRGAVKMTKRLPLEEAEV